MTIEQIKEMVNGSAYDFLRTNEHLGRKIILFVCTFSAWIFWRKRILSHIVVMTCLC